MKFESNVQEVISKLKNMKRSLLPKIMKEESILLLNLLRQGFSKQTDPYGAKWPMTNDGKPFDKNNVIKSSFSSSFTSNSASIISSLEFAKYHQTGTRHLPQRRMIPEEQYGLGNWRKPILNCARKVIRESMKQNGSN